MHSLARLRDSPGPKPGSAANNTSNESDNVFSDGTETELVTISGDNASGYLAYITVSVAA